MTAPAYAATGQASSGWLAANMICLLSMLVWSMGPPVNGILLGLSDPASLAAIRMAFAAVFLLAAWLALEGARVFRTPWLRGMAIGGLAFGLGSLTMMYGQRLTDATTVAVVSCLLPIIGIALEWLGDGRRLTPKLVAGLLLGVAGGVLAMSEGLGSARFGLGVLVALVSVVAFAWGTRATVRSLPDLTPLARTALTTLGAAVATAAVASAIHLSGHGRIVPAAFSPLNIGLFAFVGIATFGLSQLLWIMSSERLGVGIAGMHINATPFYVMAFVWALGGSWSWLQTGAALVVAAGVLVAQWPGRAAPPVPDRAPL